ncbi:response regulator transcription factor [Acidovorax sp. DW039]|uniref:response regulator transcription factor n=1 Tax=Acidovorax sp. DW039 TaxID=3095606 RepID=UPI00308ED812|nr:response regulator transcription factor [Acidovorax sp. DW039]
MRIAALDDDALQLDLFKQALQAMGHECHTYLTGNSLLKALGKEAFDLLIVDWHLPDTTGPEVVRWVREHIGQELPILFVTHRQEERDIVEGLGSGADDFMVKPVRIGELRARVAALLRRAYPPQGDEVLEFGPYRFLPDSRSIEFHGQPIELKNREYELALFLFQNMGRLLTRDHLKEILWGHVPDVMSRSLDTHISRLRNQLDLRPVNGFIIIAVYGVGYRFEAVDTEQRR